MTSIVAWMAYHFDPENPLTLNQFLKVILPEYEEDQLRRRGHIK